MSNFFKMYVCLFGRYLLEEEERQFKESGIQFRNVDGWRKREEHQKSNWPLATPKEYWKHQLETTNKTSEIATGVTVAAVKRMSHRVAVVFYCFPLFWIVFCFATLLRASHQTRFMLVRCTGAAGLLTSADVY